MADEETVRIRMDAEMKAQVEALYLRMGTTFAEAVRIFAAESLLTGGMPLMMRREARETAYGMLARYGNAELRKREKEGFAQAMEEKHREAD